MTELPHILSCAEVAPLLRCSERTIEDMARTGRLPGLLLGNGGWLFPTEALLSAVNEMARASAAKRAEPPKPAGVALPVPKRGRRKPLGLD